MRKLISILNLLASTQQEADKLVAQYIEHADEFAFFEQRDTDFIYEWQPQKQEQPAKKQKTNTTQSTSNTNNNVSQTKSQESNVTTVSTNKPETADVVKRLEAELETQKASNAVLEARVKSLEDTIQQLTNKRK